MVGVGGGKGGLFLACVRGFVCDDTDGDDVVGKMTGPKESLLDIDLVFESGSLERDRDRC